MSPQPRAVSPRTRRYETVLVTRDAAGYFQLRLDAQALCSPAGAPIILESEALAEALAQEWSAQGAQIEPDTMPLMRLVSLWLDRAATERAQWTQQLLHYCASDLVCYLSTDAPLRAFQEQHFAPVRDWLHTTHQITLATTTQITAIAQPAAFADTLARRLEAANDAELTALAMLAPLLHSVALSWAVWARALPIARALEAASCDEQWQTQRYGADAQVIAQQAQTTRDAQACAFFLTVNPRKL